MNTSLLSRAGLALASIWPLLTLSPISAQESPPPSVERVERVETADGRRLSGKIIGNAASGFRFAPDGGRPALPLESARRVTFDGPDPDPGEGDPPFHVALGLGQRISGRLDAVTDAEVRLVDGPGRATVAVKRAGALGLLQRPGEVQVLQDGFEAIDPARWTKAGEPAVVADPHREGARSLRLPTNGASLSGRLEEPVDSGRLDLFYNDGGMRLSGRRWRVELMVRRPTGEEPIQVVLGWEDESPAVVSRGGPALTVQLLVRSPGWHRLSVLFGPERTLMAIDGDELAHGKGLGGALTEVRLISELTGQAAAPKDLAAHIDDLRLVRLVEPTGSLEIDPTQDEVRLPRGEQVFGTLRAADPKRIALEVDGREVVLGWAEAAGIYFRRAPAPAAPIEGLLVRLEWRPGAGRDVDAAEGALAAVSAAALTLATPYAGTLAIPRDRLRLLQVLGRGRRLVLDASAHHLGDQLMPDLLPPQPEGGILEVPFTLEAVPPGAATLAVDVVGVEGEVGYLPYAAELRRGELRTLAMLNGQRVDYFNRHIASKNEAPERIRLPIPAGLLRPGDNVLRIEQTGKLNAPESLDDLGVLGLALEFPMPPPPPAGVPEP